MSYTIGIDEVGRGPIAGPVVVCACAVREGTDVLSLFPDGKLRDSKKLSEKKRESIVEKIQPLIEASSIVVGIGEVDASQIDERGISQAIKDAISQALNNLHTRGVRDDSFIYLDGSLYANKRYTQETIIKGDEKKVEIALASIIAKVHRDTYMKKIAELYNNYGFETHVGYGTQLHYKAIETFGLTPLHRKSFLKNIIKYSL